MDTLRFLSTYPHTRVATCTEFPVNDLGGSMSIGSIISSTVASAFNSTSTPGESRTDNAPADSPTIADHVAAADEQESVRSASTTLGTLVDTYL